MKNKILLDIVESEFLNINFSKSNETTSPQNMFVIDLYKQNKKYTIYVYCFLRIIKENQILLTSSDEFLNKEYRLINEFCKEDDSLIFYNLKNVNNILYKNKVLSIEFSNTNDLTIVLSENIKIEIIIDCLLDEFICYKICELENNNTNLISSFQIKWKFNKIEEEDQNEI